LRPGQPSGDATLFPASDVDAGMRACDCDVTTLDHYFTTRKLTRCDLVKCDVEGAELFFVRGAKGVLSKHRPIVMIEVNSMSLRRAGTTGREVLDEIASCASYLFFRIEAPSGRLVGMEPVDCEAIQHYANVLCIPVHSRALDRLGIEMRRPPHPWSDANPPPSRSSTIGGPHRSHIRPQCTESFIA
jgi:hypothetical protein